MAARTGMVLVPIVLLTALAINPAAAAEKPKAETSKPKTEASKYERRDRHTFELLDENGDGIVSLPEFKNNQMLIFYIMDRNRDLVLTRDETALPEDVFDRIAGAGGKINTMEFLNVVDSAFTLADTNHDSVIDWNEFAALMRRVRQQ